VAVVESDDAEKNRQFVERLGAKLEAETNLFTDVFYKGDLKMMGPKALLFLPEDTLDDLQKTLREYRPFIQSFGQATNLNTLFRTVNQQFRTASREANAENESMIKAVPALQRIVDQASDSLTRPGMPPSPGITALFGAGPEAEREQYITFANGRLYLVTARARTADLNENAVARLRVLIRETQVEVPGVNIGMTGEPVLEVDEMKQSQRDTALATVVSLALVILIFIYGYEETGRPIKATICLIVGLGYTMAFTTAFIGHLNILTITFMPMLIGLAIDFGVHLISRYEEELRHGASEEAALHKAMVNTGQGIFTGAATTAGAFFAMAGTDFRGVEEMGIISGAGLLICLVPMMTLLPVLLLRGRQNVLDHAMSPVKDTRAKIEELWMKRPITTLVVASLLCVVAGIAARRVTFDYNLLHMQSRGLPAVVFEQKLIDSASKSVLYAAVVTDSLSSALALEAKLTNLPSVGEVQSMAKFLSEDQSRKLAKIRDVKHDLAGVGFAETDRAPVNLKDFSQTLLILRGYLGLAADVVEKEGDLALLASLRSLRKSITTLAQRISATDSAVAGLRLAAFQQALMDDIHQTFEALRNQDDRTGLRAEDLPEPLRNRFIGVHGKFLLQVYPKEDVWQRPQQERFVADVRKVAPEATGTPVQLLEYTTLLKTSYEEAAVYSLIAIVVLVFVHFRSVTCVVLSLLPVGMGMLWMLGFMVWKNVPFNPANIMTLPLVIGIGVTNGIHILNRFAEERNPSILARSTGKAVLISALTTVAGFGSLILAEHQGIQSLGYVMAVGTATCMTAGLTFLPALQVAVPTAIT
jgi:hopanoid biosynthesis associated RND transporter like protein HpnN